MIIAVDGPTSSRLGEANVRFPPKADIMLSYTPPFCQSSGHAAAPDPSARFEILRPTRPDTQRLAR